MAKKKNNTALLLLIAAGAAAAFFLFKGDKKNQFSNMSPADKADALMSYINLNKPLNTNTEQYAAALICSLENNEDALLFQQRLQNNYNTNLTNVINNNFSDSMKNIINQDFESKNISSFQIFKTQVLKTVSVNDIKKKLM